MTPPIVQARLLTIPLGAICGWEAVDVSFLKWLQRAIGDKYYIQLQSKYDVDDNALLTTTVHQASNLRKLMIGFQLLRQSFSPDHSQEKMDMHLELPPPLSTLR